MEKTNKFSGFWRFVKRNLAIIIVVACAIAVIGIAFAVRSAQKTNLDPTPVSGEVTDETEGTGITDIPVVKPDEDDQPDEPVVTKKDYVLPIATYTIGMDYSRDSEYVLVFKKTLNEYSVHNGIDFLAEEGTAVVAINDGKVTAITNDFGMGYTVEITHEDGYVSYYSSLGEDVVVSVGDEVECGQTIGCVANTATYENLEGSHLHFELKKDGKYVNPREVLEI